MIANVHQHIINVFSTFTLINKVVGTDPALLKAVGLSNVQASIIRSLVIQWDMPMVGMIKLNSDECSKGNPGISGGCSIN